MSLFTLITGIITIIGFFSPFIKDLSKWKNYFYSAGFLSLGITIGIIASKGEEVISNFQPEHIIEILVILTILTGVFILSKILLAKEQVNTAYMLLIFTLLLVIPKMIEALSPKEVLIQPTDFVLLANHYEKKNDYTKAIDFLKYYKEKNQKNLDTEQVKKLDAKISALSELQFNLNIEIINTEVSTSSKPEDLSTLQKQDKPITKNIK